MSINIVLKPHRSPAPLVSWEEFKEAVWPFGGTPHRYQYDHFIRGLRKCGGLTTKGEAAMLLAQIIHESDGLRAKEEYKFAGSTGPNTYSQHGDHPGKSYHGRGYIQLTWSYNYKAASKDLYGDERILWESPERVVEEEEAWRTTFWFWSKNVHNLEGVKEGRFEVTTRAITGGLESPCGPAARARFQKYAHVRRAFRLPGLDHDSQ